MMMTWCQRRMGLLVLAGSVLLTMPVASSAQVTPLNNLVARVDQPRGPVPAECEQGLSPVPPLRVEVRDIELPADEPGQAVAPPSGALRAALQQTQIALTGNDRPAFNAALARERALLSTYPAGGERRTAEDIVRLHETAARLWDTQYEAPFFGETDPEYALVSGLPGFAEAVRRSTLTDDKERRFYPTAESRDFVADLAGERLQRLGIHRSTPSIREDRNQRPRSTPRASSSTPTPRRSATSATPRRTPAASSSGRSTESSSPRSETAPAPRPAATTAAPRSSTPTPPPAVATAPTPEPLTSPTPADVATETTLPSTTSGSGTLTTDVPITSGTDATATDATTTDATTTDATTTTVIDTAVTSTAVVPAVPPTSPGRSVILPAILILIGLGVLIVLFRASK